VIPSVSRNTAGPSLLLETLRQTSSWGKRPPLHGHSSRCKKPQENTVLSELNKRLLRSRISVLGGRKGSPLAVHVDNVPRAQLLTVVRVLAALVDEPIKPKPSACQDHPPTRHSPVGPISA
jgi:hypothetical protein